MERGSTQEADHLSQASWSEIRRLRSSRPRSPLLLWTCVALGGLVLWAWLSGEIQAGDVFSERRRANLHRFLTREAIPHPVLQEGFSFGLLWAWITGIWEEGGGAATLATFWIAVAAIVLSGCLGGVLGPLAARTLATAVPYSGKHSPQGPAWKALTASVRGLFILLRAIPEYVLAFFLASMIHGNAWPAVLALAIHNGGILGRLYGDTLENAPSGPLRALRNIGATRSHLYLLAAVPMSLPRFLLYFFYRFETCVREATVLGMLGIASPGAMISEARMRFFYDEMLLLVGFGVVIVLIGDLASHLARRWVREAR